MTTGNVTQEVQRDTWLAYTWADESVKALEAFQQEANDPFGCMGDTIVGTIERLNAIKLLMLRYQS